MASDSSLMQIANLGELAKKVITTLGPIFKSKMFVIYYYFSLMYIKVRIIEFKKNLPWSDSLDSTKGTPVQAV